jgi:DoxX-like family
MPRRVWIGRALSAIPLAAMLFSAAGKLTGDPQMADVMVGVLGFSRETLVVIALLELACAVLYSIPQTAVLGAVLMTGYFGGAIAAHVRVADNMNSAGPLVLGILAWAGLYLREPRLRALLPLRG